MKDKNLYIPLEQRPPKYPRRLLERGKDSGRADDQSEEIISNRIEEYNLKTAPLKAFYDKQNKLFEVNGLGSIDYIKNNIHSVIDNL